ncbi:MAG: hypothetical protein B7X39_14215 [Lysobacterales bacterium 14-68-21]|nr:MAG: hypothetical protein B7X45_13105 [Xanthomonadales bacterium 15-68-25]OZB65401.1 MAG: hypothetical protein B7X39_14215 [Xanthomonadales bacterium 14-68-21]
MLGSFHTRIVLLFKGSGLLLFEPGFACGLLLSTLLGKSVITCLTLGLLLGLCFLLCGQTCGLLFLSFGFGRCFLGGLLCCCLCLSFLLRLFGERKLRGDGLLLGLLDLRLGDGLRFIGTRHGCARNRIGDG